MIRFMEGCLEPSRGMGRGWASCSSSSSSTASVSASSSSSSAVSSSLLPSSADTQQKNQIRSLSDDNCGIKFIISP